LSLIEGIDAINTCTFWFPQDNSWISFEGKRKPTYPYLLVL